METCGVAWLDSPEISLFAATTQVYNVPAGMTLPPPLAGVMINVLPLQMVVAIFKIVALGLTRTVSLKTGPTQPL